MSWKILAFISVLWFITTSNAVYAADWKNVMIYGGIFLTNTGLAWTAYQ